MSDLLCGIGAALIVVGTYMLSIPVGVIATGCAIVAGGVLLAVAGVGASDAVGGDE